MKKILVAQRLSVGHNWGNEILNTSFDFHLNLKFTLRL